MPAAAFRAGCGLYNLLKGFRETVLPVCWFERRLRVVRERVFLVGADLIPRARTLVVRFAVPREERPEFLARLRTLTEGVPIAAQFEWHLADEETAPPRSGAAAASVPLLPHAPQPYGPSP